MRIRIRRIKLLKDDITRVLINNSLTSIQKKGLSGGLPLDLFMFTLYLILNNLKLRSSIQFMFGFRTVGVIVTFVR